MKVIYIAGPFRGIHAWAVAQNVSRAEIVAYEVFANGHAALCPHTNTRHFDGSLPDQIFIDGTLELMSRCDAVIVLPNYTRSQGTRGEIAEAERLEKPIQYLECITPAEVTRAVREIEIALNVRARTQQENEGHGETKEG